jgi:hypothetical protein
MKDRDGEPGRLALLWRGDREARRDATPHNNRLSPVFEALAELGVRAEPAVYADDMASEVREQLLKLDGVLVWVNPISDGQNRTTLDAMLRDVASKGVWVSAHPDVILKMGAKEVLHRTKHLGWGTDTHLYRATQAFREEFPPRLRSAGPRVLKQNRGNGGQGVWKVELVSSTVSERAIVRVLQAVRGSVLIPPPPEGPDSELAQPGPRIMHPLSAAAFQALRTKMEAEWTPQMMQLLDIDAESLPIIWDADFLYGPRSASGDDTYVLCEINVSSVFPFPEQAPSEIARRALARLLSAKKGRSTKDA